MKEIHHNACALRRQPASEFLDHLTLPNDGDTGPRSVHYGNPMTRMFSPPLFTDEQQTEEARKVWSILIGLIAAVTVFFPLGSLVLPHNASRFLGFAACYDLLFIGLLYLTARGRHGIASILLVAGMGALVGISSLTAGGVHSPAMIAFPLIVGIAGILRGPVAAALTGVACIIVSLALLVAELTGHLPASAVQYTAASTWVVLVFLLVVFVIVHMVGGWHVSRAEEAWRASERRYRQFFEHAQVGLYRTTPEGMILEANPALLTMLGYRSLKELAEHSLEGQGDYEPQYSRQKFREMVEKGEVRGLEAEWRRADGQIVFVRENAHAIRDDKGQILCYEGTVEDFTERKQLEAQRRQSSKMEAIGQLAGGVAHDFNNILAGFLLNIGLMQEDPDLTQTVQASLKEMELQTMRAAALTRRLLLFSRQQVLETKILDLNELLEELAKMLRRIVGEKHVITIDREQRPIDVNADSSMIDQLVMNLCVNARDAMAEGGPIVIRTRELSLTEADVVGRPDASPGRFARLEVIDTGCGMSDATMRRLFEPFFTTKEVGKGTGLGLATVYSVVKQHDGWVEVSSTPGKGSCFSVFLPSSEGTAASRPSASAPPVRIGTESVLLLEDEPAVRLATRRYLERLGYRVLEADSGPAALRQWQENPGGVDLLLADMVLPGGMSGLDVAENLKSHQPNLKIILCSGYNAELMVDRGDRAIGAIYLIKPFTADALSSAIRKCMDADR